MSAYLRLKEFAHFINLERSYDGDHLLHRGDIERMLAVVDAAMKLGPPSDHLISGWDLSEVFEALKELVK